MNFYYMFIIQGVYMNSKIFQDFKIEEWLEPEQLKAYNRHMEANDTNINKFPLPIKVENDGEYLPRMKNELERFYKELSNKTAFNYDKKFLENVNSNIKMILEIVKCDDSYLARKKMKELLERYIESDNGFIVSELDKSYAFRGVSCLPEFRYKGYGEHYNEMQTYPLELFRARKRNESYEYNRTDMLHIKLNEKEKISVQRFSTNDIPAIYLGATSYVCFLELNKPKENDFYVSAYRFNELGGKLRILNLVIGEGLINGAYHPSMDCKNSKRKEFQKKLLEFWPLICATSFTVVKQEKKSEYILSNLIMECIQDLNIDGIAYMSKKVESDYEYPHGVNLVIPIFDTEDNKIYGDICDKFELTKPDKISNSMLESSVVNRRESYINYMYPKRDREFGYKNNGYKITVDGEKNFYQDTNFSKFDDYIISEEFKDAF